MNILEKHYNHKERTTLNSMRNKKTDNFGNTTPFKILVSCLLSLRARDETTEKISKELFKTTDTPEKIINIPKKQLIKIIYSTGHYNKKAETLKSVSKELIQRFKGKVPCSKEELISIKGIGPKTANIVLNFAYGQCVIPVDTHCHRVPNRLGWVKTKTAEQTEIELEKVLPKKYWIEFNGIFVLFGREICTPISPYCSKCPINKYCPKVGVEKSR